MCQGILSRSLLLVSLCILTMGCGGSSRAKTVGVTGVLLLDGAPVPDARIRFVPSNPDGRTAIGDTDAAGKFKLSTFEPGDGIIPGEYDADVTSKVPAGNAVDTSDMAAKIASVEPKDGSVPEKYKDVKTSQLHYTFTEQDNERVVEVKLSR